MYCFNPYCLTKYPKIIIFCFLFVFTLLSSCKKKNTIQDNIAYQTVNVTIYPNDPLNFKLQVVGGWIYYNAGVNGLIIYRKTNVGANDFVALERTSTYYPDDANAKVKVQSNNFTLKDTISNSEWQIIDGAVTKGPATLPLRQYYTNFDSGTGALTIRN